MKFSIFDTYLDQLHHLQLLHFVIENVVTNYASILAHVHHHDEQLNKRRKKMFIQNDIFN